MVFQPEPRWSASGMTTLTTASLATECAEAELELTARVQKSLFSSPATLAAGELGRSSVLPRLLSGYRSSTSQDRLILRLPSQIPHFQCCGTNAIVLTW